jgi:3-deoxy-D-manno-octulosonic-acid transferase
VSALVALLELLVAPLVGAMVVLAFALSPRRGLLKALLAELPERLGAVAPEVRARLKGRPVWWLHAASSGEVAGLETVVAALAARPDAPLVVVTTTTAAGKAAAAKLPGVTHACLAPVDVWPCVARFIRAVAPRRLLLSETELWPSTILAARRAGLEPALVNARMTTRSHGRYRLIGPLLRPALESLSLVAAQTEPDAERFTALGARNVVVVGNCKYDRGAVPATTAAAEARLRELGFVGALFVAGSTHPGEEDAVLAAFLQAKAMGCGFKLVLAPRHAERASDALKSLREGGLKPALWSRAVPDADGDSLLVDVMGALPALWPRAAVAFVGGTLVPVGGHNVLEPALAGAPVLFGPHTGHTELPALLLENGGGGWRVHDAATMADRLVEASRDPARCAAVGGKARELAQGLRGATRRTLAALGEPLP